MTRVEFFGGPADGAVLDCSLDLEPGRVCEHLDYPGAEYVLFLKLGSATMAARYSPTTEEEP